MEEMQAEEKNPEKGNGREMMTNYVKIFTST